MTLIAVFNNDVMVDSCTTVGSAKFSANKVVTTKGITYTCAGSPDLAEMHVAHATREGVFDPSSDQSNLPSGNTIIVLKRGIEVWTLSLDEDGARWVRCATGQGGIQFAAGAGAEMFTGFVASGMDVLKAFETVCDVNLYVSRPIRRF